MHYDVIFTFPHFPSNFFTSSLSLPGARTLFKFMKKFEAVLSEPCRSCLMESDKEEQPDFLLRMIDAAPSEASPIQSLNRALRETLLGQPAAAQVLARGSCLLTPGPVRCDLCLLCQGCP